MSWDALDSSQKDAGLIPDCELHRKATVRVSAWRASACALTGAHAVQVLGLVKDVQGKSGKLYKEWLK